MNADVRRMLDQIDEFLVTSRPEVAGQLIDILAALRGPDNDDTQLKESTTNHIRHAALPRTCQLGRNNPKCWHLMLSDPKFRDEAWPNPNWHFHQHATDAARALGLI